MVHIQVLLMPELIISMAPAVTFDIFPDEVLQEIFASCLCNRHWNPMGHMKEWQRLVHVCQKWRQIIYGLPSFFDLHLYCSAETPFRDNLSHWPKFPLTVHYAIPHGDVDDDLISALRCIDRVRRIELVIQDTEVQDVFAAMQFPFQALTHLDIAGIYLDEEFLGDGVIQLPWDLMGGFAPSLQHLRFDAISCPSIPVFLASACGLVSLQLEDIPPDGVGYISPGDLVGGLATLSSLTTLCIKFASWRNFPPRDSSDPADHAALPALTHFVFRGEYDYLEILVAHISSPRVEDIQIEYLTPVDDSVEAGQLSQFIDHTGYFGFAQFSRAQLSFDLFKAYIKLDRAQGECHRTQLSITIGDEAPLPLAKLDFPVPRIAHVLGQLVVMLLNVGHLSINVEHHGKSDRLDNVKWLPLLRLFPAVEALRVSGRLAAHLTTVLDDIAEERITDVLYALRSLQLGDGDELVGSAGQFLAWRRYIGRPVTVFKLQDTLA